MNKSVLMTVGTSLLSEVKGIVSPKLCDLAREDFSLEQFQHEIEGLISSEDESIQHAVSVLRERWAAVQSGSADIKKLRSLSAELASLARFVPCNPLSKERDHIHLLCSDSHAGWLSGRLLELFLKDSVVDNAYLHCVAGLKARDEKSFKDIGLRNLVDEIARLARQTEDEVFIMATGGYKAGTVYGSLMGMLCQRPIYYLHEDFQENISLPVLPIHIDFDLWRINAERIELVLNLPTEYAKPFYQILDERIRHLIQQSDRGDSYKWTPAGEILYSAYKDASVWSHFQSGGRPLLSHLNRDDLKDRYGQYLLEISENIWTGDKVPEMVDHALKHHHNLFELAEMFLVPMLRSNPDFMSPEEIYVLLCVILLHDCGHSLNAFPNAPDRPLRLTEIRNWHHILGYERLNPDYYRPNGDLLLPELATIWAGSPADRGIMREFWEDELEAIATIGLYHRRDMPLKNGEHSDDMLFKPLNSRKLFFHGKEFTKSALKIAAVFRIIDSCDLQISRLGTEKEQRLKLGVINADITGEIRREQDASELVSLVSGLAGVTNVVEILEQEIEAAREFYRKKERREIRNAEEKRQMEARIQGFQDEVRQAISSIDEADKRRMVQLAVDLRREVSDRVDFKKEQEAHFARAAKVEKVSIAQKATNRFIVKIRGSERDRECLKELEVNMRDEYKKAEPVLSEYDIVIEYGPDLS